MFGSLTAYRTVQVLLSCWDPVEIESEGLGVAAMGKLVEVEMKRYEVVAKLEQGANVWR